MQTVMIEEEYVTVDNELVQMIEVEIVDPSDDYIKLRYFGEFYVPGTLGYGIYTAKFHKLFYRTKEFMDFNDSKQAMDDFLENRRN